MFVPARLVFKFLPLISSTALASALIATPALASNVASTAAKIKASPKAPAAKPISSVTVTQVKIGAADSVFSLLKNYGYSDSQRNQVFIQSKMPRDFVLTPGELYRVTQDTKAGRTELKFFDRDHPQAYSFWRTKTEVGGRQESIKYDVKLVSASGHVRGSVVENISQAVGDELVAYRFMDAFLLDYNLARVLQKNAAFSLTVQKLYDQGQFVKFGEVTHAELEILGHSVVRDFRPLKHGGTYTADSTEYKNRMFFAPVDYIKISSLYQPHRFHPIKKFRRAHLGVDFELTSGEPVYSVAPGEIIRFGRNRAAGNFIVVRHANNYEAYYDHLSSVSSLKVGEKVEPGIVLGRIGCTGYCTRPHLHFAIKKMGEYLNPLNLIRGYSFNQRFEVARQD